jgi:hypothetical protein
MGKDIVAVVGDGGAPTGSGGLEPVTFEDVVSVAEDVEAESDLVRRGQRGMVSAEWAVGIVAAVSIAGVLLAVITSGQVQDALLKFLLWVIKGFISVVE